MLTFCVCVCVCGVLAGDIPQLPDGLTLVTLTNNNLDGTITSEAGGGGAGGRGARVIGGRGLGVGGPFGVLWRGSGGGYGSGRARGGSAARLLIWAGAGRRGQDENRVEGHVDGRAVVAPFVCRRGNWFPTWCWVGRGLHPRPGWMHSTSSMVACACYVYSCRRVRAQHVIYLGVCDVHICYHS